METAQKQLEAGDRLTVSSEGSWDSRVPAEVVSPLVVQWLKRLCVLRGSGFWLCFSHSAVIFSRGRKSKWRFCLLPDTGALRRTHLPPASKPRFAESSFSARGSHRAHGEGRLQEGQAGRHRQGHSAQKIPHGK